MNSFWGHPEVIFPEFWRMPKNWLEEHGGCSRQGGACWTWAHSITESVQCGVSVEWQEGSMCEERKEAEPDHIGPVGHGKENCFFTQNNRNWKNCLELYCHVCKPQSNLCIRLHLTYPHILRMSFYLFQSKALGTVSLLFLTEINFSIVFKYQLFPLESQFRYLPVPKKNCQSSSFIVVHMLYTM